MLNNNPRLRSKRELIEKFINENLLQIENSEDIEEEFEKFWNEEREKAFNELCEEENLHNDEVKKVIDTYLYDEPRNRFAAAIPLLSDAYRFSLYAVHFRQAVPEGWRYRCQRRLPG